MIEKVCLHFHLLSLCARRLQAEKGAISKVFPFGLSDSTTCLGASRLRFPILLSLRVPSNQSLLNYITEEYIVVGTDGSLCGYWSRRNERMADSNEPARQFLFLAHWNTEVTILSRAFRNSL